MRGTHRAGWVGSKLLQSWFVSARGVLHRPAGGSDIIRSGGRKHAWANLRAMKIQAAVLRQLGLPAPYAVSRPLTIETVELAPPGPGEVLVHIRAAGLCHSDLSVIDGNRPRPMPMVLGHERPAESSRRSVPGSQGWPAATTSSPPSCRAAGIASRAPPADRRCASPASRRTRRARCCPARGGCTTARREPPPGRIGVRQYAVLAANSLVRVSSDLPFAEAALFGCAVITGVGAVVNTAAMPHGASSGASSGSAASAWRRCSRLACSTPSTSSRST
jgi:alcohol dehydrogenase